MSSLLLKLVGATGAGLVAALMLAPPLAAQDRYPPWEERAAPRPIQPYDERQDTGDERFRSPPRESFGGPPPASSYGTSTYSGRTRDDAYRPPRNDFGRADGFDPPRREPIPYRGDQGFEPPPPSRGAYNEPAYGRPYEAAPSYERHGAYDAPPPRRYEDQPRDGTFSMREIRDAGHGFFGSISQGLASVIEYAFKSKGRPNGYILGEDIGGAFVAGLRYGEGMLHTKDAGHHKVYWQGPSIGYDAGAEGSKVMVLVYNLRDPSEIYQRFGGVAGSAYVVGGVGLTFQSQGDVSLAPIRAGIGLRLGANIGYLKYTRRPTWNPF